MNSVGVILFLWTLCCALVKGLKVTYRELQELGLGCYPEDSCLEPRVEDSPGISWSHSCSCNRLCSQFDTCCVDSYYNSVKPRTVRPSCRKVNMIHSRAAYFMVDRCLLNDNTRSAWEKLCNEEWTNEKDLMRIVPVTSLFTFVTYKNYFCFRCYENTNDYTYWRVGLVEKPSQEPASDDRSQYKDGEDIPVPLEVRFEVPFEIWSLPVECVPDVILDCSPNWKDRTVREKCRAYTGIVYAKKGEIISKYKNVHCALCNFESLGSIGCKTDFNYSSIEEDFGGNDLGFHNTRSFGSSNARKRSFSFADFLTKVPKKNEAETCDKNFIWDPYHEICRRLVCLFGYVVVQNKCVKK